MQQPGLSGRHFAHGVGGQRMRNRDRAGAQPFQCGHGRYWREHHGLSLRVYCRQRLPDFDGLEHVILECTAFALIVELVVQCFVDVGIHTAGL